MDLNTSQASKNVDISSEDKAEITHRKQESSSNDVNEDLTDEEEKEYEQFEQECREKLGLIEVDIPKASHFET